MGHFKRAHAMPRRHVLQFPDPRSFLVGSTCPGAFFRLRDPCPLLDPVVESTSSKRGELPCDALLLVGSIHRSGGSMSRCLKLLGNEGLHQLACRLWGLGSAVAALGNARK